MVMAVPLLRLKARLPETLPDLQISIVAPPHTDAPAAPTAGTAQRMATMSTTAPILATMENWCGTSLMFRHRDSGVDTPPWRPDVARGMKHTSACATAGGTSSFESNKIRRADCSECPYQSSGSLGAGGPRSVCGAAILGGRRSRLGYECLRL